MLSPAIRVGELGASCWVRPETSCEDRREIVDGSETDVDRLLLADFPR